MSCEQARPHPVRRGRIRPQHGRRRHRALPEGDPGVYAEIVDVLELSNDAYQYLYGKTYFKLVDAVPWLVGWGYEANDPPFKLKKPVEMFDRINTMSTVQRIRRYDPDVVVCTHFLPARLAALLLARE